MLKGGGVLKGVEENKEENSPETAGDDWACSPPQNQQGCKRESKPERPSGETIGD